MILERIEVELREAIDKTRVATGIVSVEEVRDFVTFFWSHLKLIYGRIAQARKPASGMKWSRCVYRPIFHIVWPILHRFWLIMGRFWVVLG